MSKVHEVAVRIVKPGRDEVFSRRRGAFIEKLKTQKGVLADREFESVHALPVPDERPVFIGMTSYDSIAAVNRVQMNPMVALRFVPFFMTMELKAYLFAEQTSGPELDLQNLAAAPGSLLQLAVRSTAGHPVAAFEEAQGRFLELLLGLPGVGRHFELRSVKGKNVDGVTVGITEFESDEALASAYESLIDHEVTRAYFETFTPIASQFARSFKAEP